MCSAEIASNINFPATLAALGFVAACGGTVVGLVTAAVAMFIGKPKFAHLMVTVIGAGAITYFVLLAVFSIGSRTKALARGTEKYFCEIDCHLAYSVVAVKTEPSANSTRYFITLRTRFDETTTSPNRPKDAPLLPSPRDLRLIDDQGREFGPAAESGMPLMTPLKPGDSYTTQLEFNAPRNTSGLKLLIRTAPAWPDRLVIGDENSLWHKKTYLEL